MDQSFERGFFKIAKNISAPSPKDFGKSQRGSAFSSPSKPKKADMPEFDQPKTKSKLRGVKSLS